MSSENKPSSEDSSSQKRAATTAQDGATPHQPEVDSFNNELLKSSDKNKSETSNGSQSESVQQQKEEAENSSPLGSQQREEPKDQPLITSHKSDQAEQEHKLEEEKVQQQSVSQQQNNEIAEPQLQQQVVAEHDDAVQEYLVKKIQWIDFKTKQKKDVLIITQNENGPCPLVAICNVLFLRGDLEIRPPDREMVTFEYLIERLGDYLLNHGPNMSSSNAATDGSKREDHQQQQEDKQEEQETAVSSPTQYEDATRVDRIDSRQSTAEYVLTYRYNLDAALSILPNLQTGLDVNVRFSSIRGFEPTAELAMFDLFDVDLVHGWLVDPQDELTYKIVAEKCGSYNSVVELVVRGDTLSSDATVKNGDDKNSVNEGGSKRWTLDEEQQIQEGLIAASFLEDTATQLTYHGLESLVTAIPSNKLCVLFRNNHFSTIYKHPETSTLYILVTDSGLVSENSIVWENLGDVDQGASEFFNSDFKKPEIIRSPPLPVTSTGDPSADMDYILALSLQQNEISNAEEQRRQQREQQHQQHQQEQLRYQQQLHQQQLNEEQLAASKRKKRQSCIIC